MKKIIIYILFSIGFLSCESLVDGDLNDDPNNPSGAPAELLLTGVQFANVTTHEGLTARMSAMWTSQMKGVDRQWGDFQVYNVSGSNFNNMWDNVFYGTLRNSTLILDQIEPLGLTAFEGVVKVTQAHCIGNCTALWGDIPFREAARIEEFQAPVFDPQLDLYAELQVLLDDAIADLETGIGAPTSDIFYGGDPDLWIQAAYTLKARFYLDTRQYDLAAQAAANGISSFENSMYVPHGTVNDVDQNMYWDFLGPSRGGDVAASDNDGENPAYLVTLLDPESPVYRGNAKTNETGRFNYYYLEANESVNTPGKIEPNTLAEGIFAQSASFPLVTYQENILTLAETAARADNFEAALGHLNEYRSFLNSGGYLSAPLQADSLVAYLPYEAADFASGGMENPDGVAPATALLREIMEERYVSFFGQTIAWNDERRIRGSEVALPIQPNAGSQLPWRFVYSQDEINGNPNVPDPVPGPFDNMAIYE